MPARPAPINLILGDEPYLVEVARRSIITAVRANVPNPNDVPITTLRAGQVDATQLGEALAPSLFSDERVVVIQQAESAGKDAAGLIQQAVEQPAYGITLIVEHSGGGRTKALLASLKKHGTTVEAMKLKPKDRPGFVRQQFRQHKVRVDDAVIHTVLDSVGSDLRELASAVSQLVADTGGNVTVEAVRAYHGATAEVSGFHIADLVVAGKTTAALQATRRALQIGEEPIVIAAAITRSVSSIARMYSLEGYVDKRSLAQEIGMPPWKVDSALSQARRWSGRAVDAALIAVAELACNVRGQQGTPQWAIEHAVFTISEIARKR
ncbi:DNA polymerase III subunit delta [Corynebacterium choanae]|uniref:DNA polymerase III subunit delta n=1 Tax=Corynebacterium choanae TaxID=1862358 RepID=A0A3G6J8G9_9CORY|nr:DNA polymerase III subunit delta [Corynebacterium choanae]AZA14102.1 hypothetical protein CCHOA_08565 [Corynebacterium choanae]